MDNPFATDAFRLLFRISGLGAIFYGTYIWLFHSISAAGSAFSLVAGLPIYYIAAPLVLGGLIQFIGCWQGSKTLSVIGAGISLWFFLTAELSCIKTQPASTGVPAYVIICAFYAFSIYCKLRLTDAHQQS